MQITYKLLNICCQLLKTVIKWQHRGREVAGIGTQYIELTNGRRHLNWSLLITGSQMLPRCTGWARPILRDQDQDRRDQDRGLEDYINEYYTCTSQPELAAVIQWCQFNAKSMTVREYGVTFAEFTLHKPAESTRNRFRTSYHALTVHQCIPLLAPTISADYCVIVKIHSQWMISGLQSLTATDIHTYCQHSAVQSCYC